MANLNENTTATTTTTTNSSCTVNSVEENNKDNSNNNDNMLIFENGTILGAIFCDSSTLNRNCNSNSANSNNNNSNNYLTRSLQNISIPRIPILIASQQLNNDSDNNIEGILYNNTRSTITIPNINRNNNNNSNSNNNNNNNNNITIDHNTSLLDNSSYELDNNNYNVNNNINNSNSNNNNNNYVNSNQIDLLNSSACSFESRVSTNGNKRYETSTSVTAAVTAADAAVNNSIKSFTKLKSNANTEFYDSRYHPPQYTAIYFDAIGNPITTNGNNIMGSGNGTGIVVGGGGGGGVVGNIGVTNYFHGISYDNLNQINHQQQYSDHANNNNIGIVSDIGIDNNQYSATNGIDGNRTSGAADIIQRRRGCFRQWFTRPSLPFVIGVLALGGVACTLGGIVLGSTGLIEHSTQYLSAALLMIGIGVSLLVISGAIWRLSIPDEVENCPCFRHLETCRNCNSPYCGNRLLTTHSGYMYPEFQHRPPPPSYVTSLNECTVGLLFHHEVANIQRNDSIRISTPPPAYRSSQSLSVFVPLHATTVSPSQRSLFPEISLTSAQSSILSELETTQMFSSSTSSEIISSQSDIINSDMNSQISGDTTSRKQVSTVHESSSQSSKKNQDSTSHLTDITIE